MDEKLDLKELLASIYSTEYALTKNGDSISQRERNKLKYDLTEAVVGVLLVECFDYITQTADGYIIEIQNEELGLIPVELNLKVKNVTYDLDGAIEDYEIKQKKKK